MNRTHRDTLRPALSLTRSTLSRRTRRGTRRRLGAGALGLLCAFVLGGCGSDADGDGSDSGKTAATLHPGPCKTALVRANGDRVEDFFLWTWDANGRLKQQQRLDAAVSTEFPGWTLSQTWSADGKLEHEVLTTNEQGRRNHDWTWTYGSDGKAATRVGTQDGYGTESCVFEYSTVPSQPDDFSLICDFSYDTYDKEGNRTGTVTGKYGEHHEWKDIGEGLKFERVTLDDAAGGTPSNERTRYFDAAGRLERIETDSALAGYADHIERFTYDAEDRVATRTVDEGGEGTDDLRETRTYDAAGNLVEQAFDVGKAGAGVDGKEDYRWVHAFDCW